MRNKGTKFGIFIALLTTIGFALWVALVWSEKHEFSKEALWFLAPISVSAYFTFTSEDIIKKHLSAFMDTLISLVNRRG